MRAPFVQERLRIAWANLVSPLPNPKKEARKFLFSGDSFSLEHLFASQINEIVRLVLDEARKSRGFGLLIRPEELEKEEMFFLSGINALGGPVKMRHAIPFGTALSMFSKTLHSTFKEEKRRYFEAEVARGDRVRNKYSCHLECTVARLVQEVYSAEDTKLHTA